MKAINHFIGIGVYIGVLIGSHGVLCSEGGATNLSSNVPGHGTKERPPVIKVLFIGNSQMAQYDLPSMIKYMADAAPSDRPRIEVGRAIIGGKGLKGHWEAGTADGTARGLMESATWDLVIIQDIYAHVANRPSPQVFSDYANRFDHAIKQAGQKPLVFATASVTEYMLSDYRYPDSFRELNEMQIEFGRKWGTPVAAGGYAWMKYLGKEPTEVQRLDLYDQDKGHPGLKGTYLYACLLYAFITGESPEGLANDWLKQIRTRASSGGIGIPAEEAVRMQQAAWAQYLEDKMRSSRPGVLASQPNPAAVLARYKEILSEPGRFTPEMETCEKRINASAKTVRQKVIEALADMMSGVSGEEWRSLVEAANDPHVEIRKPALRVLLIGAAPDKVNERISKVEQEVKRTAIRVSLAPALAHLRELSQERKWQVLVEEFQAVDFTTWEDRELAGEACLLRGQAYAALMDGARAEGDLREALEFMPGSQTALNSLAGNYAANLKDNKKALDAYQQLHQLTGVHPRFWLSLQVALKTASLLGEEGRKDEALALLRKYDLPSLQPEWRAQFEAAINALSASPSTPSVDNPRE